MPRAQQTLDDVGWLERTLLRLFFGGAPWAWSPQAHKMTGWRFWAQPDGEVLPLYKDRDEVADVEFADQPYPESVAIDPNTKARYPIDTTDDAICYSVDLWMGTYNGEPVQVGHPGRYRTVTYGYAEYGVHKIAPAVPVPVGDVLHCGDPNIASDRHAIILDPNTGEVHELIQYDEHAPDTAVTNQALGWGKWKDGRLVEGESSTATNTAIHTRLWDRTSADQGGHELGFVLGDYVGADGTLVEGPHAGDWYYLPSSSESYRAMVALGGECAAVARAANKYGLRLVDRSGYADVSGNLVPGRKMKMPAIGIQWGAWARSTNLGRLEIAVHDLRLVYRPGY